jgi:hypothetical protein
MRDKILCSDNMTEEHNQRSVTSGVWTRFNFIRVVVGSFEHGNVVTFEFYGKREFRESWANVAYIVYCGLVGEDCL